MFHWNTRNDKTHQSNDLICQTHDAMTKSSEIVSNWLKYQHDEKTDCESAKVDQWTSSRRRRPSGQPNAIGGSGGRKLRSLQSRYDCANALQHQRSNRGAVDPHTNIILNEMGECDEEEHQSMMNETIFTEGENSNSGFPLHQGIISNHLLMGDGRTHNNTTFGVHCGVGNLPPLPPTPFFVDESSTVSNDSAFFDSSTASVANGQLGVKSSWSHQLHHHQTNGGGCRDGEDSMMDVDMDDNAMFESPLMDHEKRGGGCGVGGMTSATAQINSMITTSNTGPHSTHIQTLTQNNINDNNSKAQMMKLRSYDKTNNHSSFNNDNNIIINHGCVAGEMRDNTNNSASISKLSRQSPANLTHCRSTATNTTHNINSNTTSLSAGPPSGRGLVDNNIGSSPSSDETIRKMFAMRLLHALNEACAATPLQFELTLPPNFIYVVASHILSDAADAIGQQHNSTDHREPGAMDDSNQPSKGCLIHISLEGHNDLFELTTLYCNPYAIEDVVDVNFHSTGLNTRSSQHLYLTLREAATSRTNNQQQGCLTRSQAAKLAALSQMNKHMVHVCTSYKLIKQGARVVGPLCHRQRQRHKQQ